MKKCSSDLICLMDASVFLALVLIPMEQERQRPLKWESFGLGRTCVSPSLAGMVKKVVDIQILQILSENNKSIERLGWKNFDCEECSFGFLKMLKSLAQVAPSITKGLLRKKIGAAKLAISGTEAELLVSKIKHTITYVRRLDGQNRQSPIASDFGSRTQIAALFAVLLYRNV